MVNEPANIFPFTNLLTPIEAINFFFRVEKEISLRISA
jgi:hypothetical protein